MRTLLIAIAAFTTLGASATAPAIREEIAITHDPAGRNANRCSAYKTESEPYAI